MTVALQRHQPHPWNPNPRACNPGFSPMPLRTGEIPDRHAVAAHAAGFRAKGPLHTSLGRKA